MKTQRPPKDTYHWALELACRQIITNQRTYALIEWLRSPLDGKPPTKYELLLADMLDQLKAARTARLAQRTPPASSA